MRTSFKKKDVSCQLHSLTEHKNKKMKKKLIGAFAILSGIFLAACVDSGNEMSPSGPNSNKALFSVTGNTGTMSLQGITELGGTSNFAVMAGTVM